MTIKTVLFDLDGTLTDSKPGIINSLNYSIKKLGLPQKSAATLQLFIGPPLLASYEKYFGLTALQAEDALKAYREYYVEQGIFENSVYQGVPAMLAALQQTGYQIFMTTSKPEKYAEQICEHFGLATYFNGIYGASMDEKRAAKSEIIAYALNAEKLTQPAKIAMVGDRENDINGAHDHHLQSVAVTYGFGSITELSAAKPTKFIDQPEKLLPTLQLL
ncbi:HAD-IA family hydrolase [Loigolactobacillus backii]|uniref:Haloacid dehalogenase n=1 Tax=Loigolactobacillus backii TaxID=375175 RepID=A0A192H1Y7_9LACO|nr:HAD-IA family hydrolase [Loigolactobacillus backii]ANK62252.1 haloacid dehalogenase [Loigolactobacillus backii]ANK70735.1 haloacid dehalogenase [Loigolactobacillus backii]MDA5387663.1 HAD-IA family hydrolase [Loigolactobacillus backii]MDA5390180.1 HAD-IA family hydrolase [Loigolactobacillus backii]PIO82680.1 haloacid dehalogenase [Loigolactobacillus backii]